MRKINHCKNALQTFLYICYCSVAERSRLLFDSLSAAFNAFYEQPRALCHAPVTNIQKCLQRIFATVYFARSFFDYPFLQQFILRQFFLIAKINSQKSLHKKFLHIYFCTSFFCIFIFVYLIKMTI